MADSKISGLPAAASALAADLYPVDQAGTTKSVTGTQIRAGVVVPILEADITLADNTTNNVSSTAHGFAPKSPADATKYLNGAATPAYSKIGLTTDVTGVLPVANGGTGVSTENIARATNSVATLSIAANTVVDVTFDTTDFDTNPTMHSTVTNTARITAKVAGRYLVYGGVFWTAQAANGVTFLLTRLAKNGTVIEGSRSYFPPLSTFVNNGQAQNVSCIITLAVNDFVTLQVFHDAGGPLTINLNQGSFGAAWLGA